MRSHHAINAVGSLLIPLSSLAVTPLLARALGAAGQGQFTTAQSLVVVCSSLLGLGASDAIAVYWTRWSKSFQRGVLGVSIVVPTMMALILALFYSWRGLLPSSLVIVLTFGATFFSVALLLRGRALAAGSVNLVGVEKVITSTSRMLITSGLFLSGNLSLVMAVSALVLPQLLGATYLLAMVKTRNAQSVDYPNGLQLTHSEATRLLAWSLLGGLGGVLLVNLDPLVLLPLIGKEQLGLYALALLVAETFTVAARPFRDSAMVKVGVNLTFSDFKQEMRYCAGLMLFGLVLAIALMKPVIPWIFGVEFRDAVVPCLIMSIGGAAKGFGFLVNGILIKMDCAKIRANSTLIAVIVSVGGMFLLSDYGALGAAVAATVAYFAMLILSLVGGIRRGQSLQGSDVNR